MQCGLKTSFERALLCGSAPQMSFTSTAHFLQGINKEVHDLRKVK